MLIQISQFILGLSLLVVLHELGHFIPAVAFRTRVEKFYLFFNPWFSLFKTNIRGTEVGIGWLPLGGYVKIAGMVDESMDTEGLAEEPKPYEYRSKKPWQRLIIILGGVTVNFIVAVAIYAGMGAYYGEKYVDTADLKGGVWATPVAQSMGMKSGDVPVAVNGREIARFDEVSVEMLLGSGSSLTVLRDGERVDLPITQAFVAKAIEEKTPWMFPRVPYVVKEFAAGSPAEKAGMAKGDALVALNGESLTYFDEYLERIPDLAGQAVTITVDRAGERVDLPVTVSDEGKIGVYYQDNLAEFFPVKTDTHSGLSAIPYGWNRAVSTLSSYARQIKLMFQPETGAYKEAGGFLTILKQYPSTWDWEHFWGFTAFLSLALAFLNVLPIPALDGGHAVFAIIEWVTGRAPSTRVMEGAQMIGFFLLLALFVLVNGNDLFKALGL